MRLNCGIVAAGCLEIIHQHLIKGEDEAITVSDLADALGEPRSSITTALERLQEEGLVAIDAKFPGWDKTTFRPRKLVCEVGAIQLGLREVSAAKPTPPTDRLAPPYEDEFVREGITFKAIVKPSGDEWLLTITRSKDGAEFPPLVVDHVEPDLELIWEFFDRFKNDTLHFDEWCEILKRHADAGSQVGLEPETFKLALAEGFEDGYLSFFKEDPDGHRWPGLGQKGPLYIQLDDGDTVVEFSYKEVDDKTAQIRIVGPVNEAQEYEATINRALVQEAGNITSFAIGYASDLKRKFDATKTA